MSVSDVIIFLTTRVASTEVFFLVLVLISFHVWRLRGVKIGLLVLGSSVFLGLTVTGLKRVFAVSRPVDSLVEASGYAFPSGHAAGVVFMAFVLEWYLRSVLQVRQVTLMRVLLLIFVLTVGYSRMYLGVHTFWQVLAGGLVGLIVGVGFHYLIRKGGNV